MSINEYEQEFKHILQGSCVEGTKDHCTAIRNILCGGPGAGKTSKREFESKLQFKKEQEELIRKYALENDLYTLNITGEYLTQGGESKVYLQPGGSSVLKLNDGGYYSTWFEFFNSILLHNIFFTDTAYKLVGIFNTNQDIQILLEQPFIVSKEPTHLVDIKSFLAYNNFENIKRQDYYSSEYGILLEDMHDENVITKEEKLFFIDTVFYLVAEDYLM